MFTTFVDVFGAYYGLDWLSVALGLYGLYLISEHRRIGFIYTFISVLVAFFVALMAQQYGFLVANAVTAFIALRGYYKWCKNPATR